MSDYTKLGNLVEGPFANLVTEMLRQADVHTKAKNEDEVRVLGYLGLTLFSMCASFVNPKEQANYIAFLNSKTKEALSLGTHQQLAVQFSVLQLMEPPCNNPE